MAYDFTIDHERGIFSVRYSGTIAVAERQAAAEQLLGDAMPPGLQRILLDYRRATSSDADEAASRELAVYLGERLAGREARVAWLVNYDHQLDATVERLTSAQGIANRRFRDQDEAIAWLQHDDRDAPGFARAARRAQGTFEVSIASQSPDNPPAQAAGLARLALDKRYSGPLVAIGQGEMLADGGGGRKDGAYVAMERVTGTLDGSAGSFALVHRALMRDGTPQDWSVMVVPGSGTDALAGLEGSLRISVEQGRHHYDFEYTLPG